ncbi:MAG: hypothetical protein ACJ780_11585 [Solirubrobacteraceae bacterium]
MPPEACFVVEDAVSGIREATPVFELADDLPWPDRGAPEATG